MSADVVKELCARTGLSRATVYRRLKRGETPDEILFSQGIIPEQVAETPDDQTAAVGWCKAVLWAAEHINVARMTQQKAGSLLKYSLWQFGRDNPKELVVQLVPKALAILDRNKALADSSAIAEIENLSIAEMESLLESALAESGAKQ